MNVNNITELRLLDQEEVQELGGYEVASRRLLKLDANIASPDDIVGAIDSYVNDVRERELKEPDEERILLLACLWGQQVSRSLNWKWVLLDVQGEEYYAIVSPLREYVVFPFVYFRELLSEEDRDNTALLLYNMLKSDSLTVQEAYSYHVLE